jgi:anti-anti-sigma factor
MSPAIVPPDIQILQPSGILDSTQTKKLRSEIDAMLNSGSHTILLNLEQVTFMDSSGLGALVLVLKTVRAAEGKLYLCSLNGQIRLLFEITGMDKLFEIFVDQTEFSQKMQMV